MLCLFLCLYRSRISRIGASARALAVLDVDERKYRYNVKNTHRQVEIELPTGYYQVCMPILVNLRHLPSALVSGPAIMIALLVRVKTSNQSDMYSRPGTTVSTIKTDTD